MDIDLGEHGEERLAARMACECEVKQCTYLHISNGAATKAVSRPRPPVTQLAFALCGRHCRDLTMPSMQIISNVLLSQVSPQHLFDTQTEIVKLSSVKMKHNQLDVINMQRCRHENDGGGKIGLCPLTPWPCFEMS
jgi:hypothetical protein